MLLGAVIEALSGMAYRTFLLERFFRPLGMPVSSVTASVGVQQPSHADQRASGCAAACAIAGAGASAIAPTNMMTVSNAFMAFTLPST